MSRCVAVCGESLRVCLHSVYRNAFLVCGCIDTPCWCMGVSIHLLGTFVTHVVFMVRRAELRPHSEDAHVVYGCFFEAKKACLRPWAPAV
jgi:hypothetical protein